jgi:hypothetical protein
MKNLLKPFIIILTILSLSACLKDTRDDTLVCEIPVTPYAAFKVVDQSSGEDLFFTATPKYQLKDFYAFTTQDKARHDTIKPKIYGTGTDRLFLIPLDYSKTKDTLIIKVANTPDDQFIYTVKKDLNPCGGSALDQAYFNNDAIVTTDGRYIIKK